MMALYHYHRFLTIGAKGFEAEFAHGGIEPFYPYPADGSPPKSLADLRINCEVIRTRHASIECKWYFSRKDHSLRGMETFITRDGDTCELYFFNYRNVEGRKLPHRIEVRYCDKRYAILTIDKYAQQDKLTRPPGFPPSDRASCSSTLRLDHDRDHHGGICRPFGCGRPVQ